MSYLDLLTGESFGLCVLQVPEEEEENEESLAHADHSKNKAEAWTAKMKWSIISSTMLAK